MNTTPDERKLPADPAYAWAMIPVAILMQAGTAPGQTFGVSMFLDPIREELGLSETYLSGSYMLASALAALPLMWIGRLMDRWGLRVVSLALVLAVGSACFAISQIEGLIGLTCAFFALRTFGQGALSMAAANTLGMWFTRRLGFASGLAGVGMSATVALAPLGFLALINALGWRNAYATIGLIVVATLVPLILLVYRNNRQANQSAENQESDESAFSLQQAVRTPAYWVATLATALVGTVCTAIFFCLTRLFKQNGFTPGEAALFITISATAMAIMQVKGGLLADRVPLRILLGVAMALLALSSLCLGWPSSLWIAYLGAATMGASQGLVQVTSNTLWPRYFGRQNLGSIRSSVWTVLVISCSVGPFIMGATFDLLGSYTPSIWLFVGLAAGTAVAAVRYGAPPELVDEIEEDLLPDTPALASS